MSHTLPNDSVIDLDDRLERRFPPLHEFEVENDEVVLWRIVHERVELMATIWERAGLGPERWDSTAYKVRSMKAEDDWRRDGGRWVGVLSGITTGRDSHWRMPLITRFIDAQSLGNALAGCLIWHTLRERKLERAEPSDDGALIGWRTWVYLQWRARVDRLFARHRINASNLIVRPCPLVNGDGHSDPDSQCGHLIEAWPLAAKNLRFANGFERIRARILLGHWIEDVPEKQRFLVESYDTRMR